MLKTPKGFRIHIGIFGRRNVGKSSLLNALVGQSISIVSSTPGTTTDPVEKAMELQPIGPVVFIDTAGVDDIGALGGKRVEKTIKILERTDLAILVTEANIWTDFERGLIQKFEEYEIPYLVVFNKIDKSAKPDQTDINKNVRVVYTSAVSKVGIDELRQAIIETIPDEYFRSRPIIGDLINPGDLVVLVVPIDKEAPKGRLILPQVQTIRDILDHNGYCIVVKESELKSALENLKTPPAITVTDSQVFDIVNQMVPEHIPLTSFSILYARQKGDLREFV
ncbi:MAG: [FeFe] hydrogenase H-cluster maturation GTPase HydF, partial [Candidatus Neomarinimicrobiota bacterium]